MPLPPFSRAISALLLCLPAAAAQQHIAPTPPNTPAAELATFTVPAGFTVQLVAAEPDIQKPMQIAFDADGKLWVTTSHAYPFAADTPHDKLFVLSDFGPDGKAKKVVTFADNLNIPIGVLPLPGGKSVIVSEVGKIVKLTDADGDGKADRKDVLFTGFGTRDTHGMTNSFTLRPDGWVYACHGFSNESRVTGADGHTVTMTSGHTFRFRPDGSRIEVVSRGQVNPFGMTTDPWGNIYTADCHSKPITQIIPGAYYDSFGKPHDGLGYAPHVTRHDHGSTALCGLAWYDSTHFPAAYRGTMFLGNVVTNRINFDRIEWKGSTPVAVEQPDFLTSSDPWFRPTDIQVGPDGAIYFSDFYNRIIGHYEVDLKHPGRDKDRGRVWRVVYTAPPSGPDGGPNDATQIAAVRRMRTLAENWTLSADERREAIAGLAAAPRVARAAVEVFIAHADANAAEPLTRLILTTPAEDTHLIHAAKIALRDQLFDPQAAAAAAAVPGADSVLDAVALGMPTPAAATRLAARLKALRDPGLARLAAEHVARNGSAAERERVWAELATRPDLAVLVELVSAFRKGLDAAGRPLPLTPESARTRVAEGLAGGDRAALEAFRLADAMNINATMTAFDLLKAKDRPEAVRAAALAHLVGRNRPDGLVPTCGDIATDAAAPAGLRDQALGVFAASARPADKLVLQAMLKDAPYRRAATIAAGLAGTADGADLLVAAVADGKASARLLQEKAVRDRVAKHPAAAAKSQTLTANLPTPEARLQELISARGAGFAKAKPNLAAGQKVFAKTCAACHQLGGEGGKVGPQLDGIGNRGADRLLEDVLDPNRNVDAAFRATRLDLTDGRQLTGLLLRQDGAVYVIADAAGKEQRVPVAEVEKKVILAASPMPANVAEAMTEAEFYDLFAYLLDRRAK